MLNMISSRRGRGCGKCGKAEAFFAKAFPSSWWKSSIRSCRRPPLLISTAAAFSTAPRARRFFRFADEEPDIRNGKNPSKVRNRIQTSTDRTDRSRPDHDRAGRARSSDIQKRHRTMARSLPQQRPGRSTIQPRTPIGSRERKAQGQGGRARHADGPFKKIASLGSAAEKRGYIDNHREELGSISKACQVAGLPSSTFYYKPNKQHRKRRDDEDEKLRQQIEGIQEEFPGYGYRRVKRELKRRGRKVNEKRVRRVMKKFGLKPITWRTFVRTTDSRHALPVYPNLIKNRQVCAVTQACLADITYIRIRSSFVYLAAILDLYSRKIVGWGHLETHRHGTLCLCIADGFRNPPISWLHPSLRPRCSIRLGCLCGSASPIVTRRDSFPVH